MDTIPDLSEFTCGKQITANYPSATLCWRHFESTVKESQVLPGEVRELFRRG